MVTVSANYAFVVFIVRMQLVERRCNYRFTAGAYWRSMTDSMVLSILFTDTDGR